MYSINDYIVYGKNGVCKIIDIRKEKFNGLEEQTYYVMHPVYSDKSIIYTPIKKNLDKFRKIMSVNEVYDLIKAMDDQETIWIENDQARNEKFRNILRDGNQREIIKLIKTLYFHRQNQLAKGKKLHVSDDRIMKEAEKILYDEFAYVLDIKPEEVLPFILGELRVNEKSK